MPLSFDFLLRSCSPQLTLWGCREDDAGVMRLVVESELHCWPLSPPFLPCGRHPAGEKTQAWALSPQSSV